MKALRAFAAICSQAAAIQKKLKPSCSSRTEPRIVSCKACKYKPCRTEDQWIQNRRLSWLRVQRKTALLRNYDCPVGQYFSLYGRRRANLRAEWRCWQLWPSLKARRNDVHARHLERHVFSGSADRGENPAPSLRLRVSDCGVTPFRKARVGAVESLRFGSAANAVQHGAKRHHRR